MREPLENGFSQPAFQIVIVFGSNIFKRDNKFDFLSVSPRIANPCTTKYLTDENIVTRACLAFFMSTSLWQSIVAAILAHYLPKLFLIEYNLDRAMASFVPIVSPAILNRIAPAVSEIWPGNF